MSAKNTPGPWVIRHKASVVGPEGFGVAACGGYYSSQIDPAELLATHAANARLISAVPDMLAALERVMTLQISAGGDEVFADVKAAIAKARGQS